MIQLLRGFFKPFVSSLIINYFLFLLLADITYIKKTVVKEIFYVDFISFSKGNIGYGRVRKGGVKTFPSLTRSLEDKNLKNNEVKTSPQTTPGSGNINISEGEDGETGGGGIYDSSELDSGLQILYMVKPEYPEELRLLNKEKRVTVEFLVNEEGKVEKVEILEPAEEPLFVESTVEAVKKWRFTQPVLKGKRVKVRFRLPVKFELK